MELFVWMWAFDNRMLCGLTNGGTQMSFIWLIPTFIAAAVLGSAWLMEYFNDPTPLQSCLAQDDGLKKKANFLSKLLLIQQGILILILFAAFLSFIVSHRIQKRSALTMPSGSQQSTSQQTTKQKLPAGKDQEQASIVHLAEPPISNKLTVHDWQVRHESLKSVPSKLLLFLAVVNYSFSFALRSNYQEYMAEPVVAHNLSCTMPGANVLVSYSIFLVMGTGSVVVTIYFLSCFYKVAHLLAQLICPLKVLACKRCLHRRESDLSRFENEFDFDMNEDDEEDELGHQYRQGGQSLSLEPQSPSNAYESESDLQPVAFQQIELEQA